MAEIGIFCSCMLCYNSLNWEKCSLFFCASSESLYAGANSQPCRSRQSTGGQRLGRKLHLSGRVCDNRFVVDDHRLRRHRLDTITGQLQRYNYLSSPSWCMQVVIFLYTLSRFAKYRFMALGSLYGVAS